MCAFDLEVMRDWFGAPPFVAYSAASPKRARSGAPDTKRLGFMNAKDLRALAAMPKLSSRRVDVLLEDVLGCRWSFSVLRAVASGVHRPGALERHIEGISAKVLADRLRAFTRAGIFERVAFAELPPRVEYRLTEFGRKFLRVTREIEKLQAELEGARAGTQRSV